MKIFSAFDTQFKKKSMIEEQKKYGINKVHLLEKSSFFFFKNIFIPLFIVIWTTILSGYISIEYLKTLPWVTIIIMIFIFIIWFLYATLFKNYIDYKMDYCIVTPEEIILTEQSWLFKRAVRTLDAKKIKSIYIQKKNLIDSLFNDWSIIFMSDGDELMWEIVLEYIYDPEKKKEKLQDIIIRKD
jgi:hypothetical protein